MATTTRVSCGRPSRSRLLSIAGLGRSFGARGRGRPRLRRGRQERSLYYRHSTARSHGRQPAASAVLADGPQPLPRTASRRAPAAVVKPLKSRNVFRTPGRMAHRLQSTQRIRTPEGCPCRASLAPERHPSSHGLAGAQPRGGRRPQPASEPVLGPARRRPRFGLGARPVAGPPAAGSRTAPRSGETPIAEPAEPRPRDNRRRAGRVPKRRIASRRPRRTRRAAEQATATEAEAHPGRRPWR